MKKIASNLGGAAMPTIFLRHTPEQIAWHALALIEHNSAEPMVLISQQTEHGGTEIFIWWLIGLLFASVAGELDR